MMDKEVIKRVTRGQHVFDGAGVSLNRLIANSETNNIDPFFLLDEFRSDNPEDYIKGFPMHPHRGIETITYMIKGSFKHKDSRGGGGILKSGEVQWMTAGRGILHEEMPAMENGSLWGYQLWLNLPKRMKWLEPEYQHLSRDNIPMIKKNGYKVLIISGSFEGIDGPARNNVPAEYYDIYLEKEKSIQINAKADYNSLLYIHSGKLKIQDHEYDSGTMIEFIDNNEIIIKSISSECGFLFLSALPNNEPYARGGPFVMNTQEEIEQAYDDYQNGRLF